MRVSILNKRSQMRTASNPKNPFLKVGGEPISSPSQDWVLESSQVPTQYSLVGAKPLLVGGQKMHSPHNPVRVGEVVGGGGWNRNMARFLG